MSKKRDIEITEETERALARVEEAASESGLATLKDVPGATRALRTAYGLQQLRRLIEPCVPVLMELQGSPLGFRTDRDSSGGYPPDVVREVAIEALLRGLTWSGNEWNVIGGQLYVTHQGYRRLVGELPGVTDVRLGCGLPSVQAGGAVVPVRASYRFEGRERVIQGRYAVRLTKGQGADAAVTKAKRRALREIWEEVTGSHLTGDDDPDVVEAAPAEAARLDRASEGTRKLLRDVMSQVLAGDGEEALAEAVGKFTGGTCTSVEELTEGQARQMIKAAEKELSTSA